jgi:CBS domain containing-hemolysin-like protein
MVAEGLPLVLNRLLSPRANWAPYLISTTAIALFGEIIPQTIMPLYILEIGGRTMWLLKCLMLFLALPACIPAYALRKFKTWRVRAKQDKADGIMEADELVEFMRLHEQSQCFGGPLTDECGAMARSVVLGQRQLVDKYVRPWMNCTVLDANAPINVLALTRIRSCNDSYILVVKSNDMRMRASLEGNGESNEEDELRYCKAPNDGVEFHGILFPRVLISSI